MPHITSGQSMLMTSKWRGPRQPSYNDIGLRKQAPRSFVCMHTQSSPTYRTKKIATAMVQWYSETLVTLSTGHGAWGRSSFFRLHVYWQLHSAQQMSSGSPGHREWCQSSGVSWPDEVPSSRDGPVVQAVGTTHLQHILHHARRTFEAATHPTRRADVTDPGPSKGGVATLTSTLRKIDGRTLYGTCCHPDIESEENR